MNILADLDAFLQEPKRCRFLDSHVTKGQTPWRVMFACECGASICRTVQLAEQ